jgi:D-serine deaminase-like pyridoxal phosphate-dependent protein
LVPPALEIQHRQVASLCRSATVTVVCDHFAQAEPIAAACRSEEVAAGLLLRVDVGRQRLGIRPGPDLADLACGVSRLAGVRLAGLFVGETSVPIGSVGRLVADKALPRFLDRCLSSLRRAGCDAETVSVGDIDDLSGMSSVATEARTPLPLFGSGCAAVLTAIVGRPTRDVAIVDAGCDVLGSSAMVAGVQGDEADVAFVGRDFSVLKLHQPDYGWTIGDVIALFPGAELQPRTGQPVLIGESGRWRVEVVC